MMSLPGTRNSRRKGNNIIEFALIAPWYVLLFGGAFDFGVYNYALIGVQNAARTAAMYCAASSTTCSAGSDPTACQYALDQLRDLPNVGSGTTTCGTTVTVSVSYVSGPDSANAAQVKVGYTTPPLFNIASLPGQYTASRTVTMRTPD